MAYIPKNKIQTNLYTSGEEFILLKDNSNYTGPYYKLYNGKFFTGNTPNDLSTIEIIPISPRSSDSNGDGVYYSLFPTEQDYKNGEFTRYFTCRRNQPIFSEVDKKTFDKYKQKNNTVFWRTNKPFSLFWQLTGDINQVAQTNKNITELTEQREKVIGLGLFLKENWAQYYKEKP
jgi:hypothetical protein